ncbi:C-type lectin domain family 2 member B isoform X1 [Anolis carolinensis]|uniref:C-type lectin domain family 2 member B isoform X1 n=1 Tax=Anolis carolinensis TaxID=28377 RepID=UPI002F2B2B8C
MTPSNGNYGNGPKMTEKVAQSNGNAANGPKTADQVEQGNGDSENRPQPLEQMGLLDQNMKKATDGGWKAKWSKTWFKAVIFSVILVTSNVVTAFISVTMTKSSVPHPVIMVLSCPSGWVGYEGKCYYFSESETNWNLSQSNCSASGASLVTIENQKEMDFIMQAKGPTEYWIGLKRKKGQHWEWVNGTLFNDWLDIGADGPCAYLNDEKASSTLCGTRRNWICGMSARTA